MHKRLLKILLGIVIALLVIIGVLMLYIQQVAYFTPPQFPLDAITKVNVIEDSGLFVYEQNWFRKSESGLYELYVEGDAVQRGLAMGALTQSLAHYQEKVFTDQINQMVPSAFYRKVLMYFIGWFNRDLDKHVAEEYQQEIYGIAQFASPDFDSIAPAYQRILNYHAAHDIGHALQNMSLVGCTSFATWGNSSQDSSLIIGRNFDFYVGDDFAKNKIVAFVKPDKGHKFMMLTFGGMVGVLSGMNEAGLTVTINAAKSEIPSAAATPVSLVAREILQYAATIEEAYAIASKRELFVAESFLIGSANDNRAALIEKSNTETALYQVEGTQLISTNHFQSDQLGNTELNQTHKQQSASVYRYERVAQLLEEQGKNTIEKTAALLRNQQGLGGKDIGMGNEKLINQLIAHHGIIFQPEKRLVWISTTPWQLGKFVCYDLNKVFQLNLNANQEIYESDKEIKADAFITTPAYADFVKYSAYRFAFAPRENLHPDSVVAWNPDLYHSYMLAGDYWFDRKDYNQARKFYELALTKEIATVAEREHITKNLATCITKAP